LELGVPDEVKQSAFAYLVVMLESSHADRLEEDVQALAELVAELDAIDVYVLPSGAATQLVEAREKAFWLAKANNANDIVDIVVPRADIPQFMTAVSELAQEHGAWIAGCGHAGDGNVHLAVFQNDDEQRGRLMHDLFAAAVDLGGTISGEHGIGTEKKRYFLELEDPVKVALMQRIKTAFDPSGVLNPGKLFD
jgi:glycolate oxidase